MQPGGLATRTVQQSGPERRIHSGPPIDGRGCLEVTPHSPGQPTRGSIPDEQSC